MLTLGLLLKIISAVKSDSSVSYHTHYQIGDETWAEAHLVLDERGLWLRSDLETTREWSLDAVGHPEIDLTASIEASKINLFNGNCCRIATISDPISNGIARKINDCYYVNVVALNSIFLYPRDYAREYDYISV